MKTRQEALDYGLSFQIHIRKHHPRPKLATHPRKGQQKGFPVDLRAQWFYQLKCQGISCLARLLEGCLPIGHPRLAPEQGQLEYYHSRWQHTG